MNIRLFVVGVLLGVAVILPREAGGQSQAAPARTITVTVTDPVGPKMQFSTSEIVAKPGERLRVQIVSKGTLPKIAMGHNWVLLTIGSDARKFADAASAARATDYIPPALKAQVIAHTGLVGPGETSEVTFTVPKAPGRYTYLCSFSGHFAAGMSGALVVK